MSGSLSHNRRIHNEKKKNAAPETSVRHIDSECRAMYDDIFRTVNGACNLEPSGHVVYDPSTKKYFFSLSVDKINFILLCQKSLELGRNLFADEWIE